MLFYWTAVPKWLSQLCADIPVTGCKGTTSCIGTSLPPLQLAIAAGYITSPVAAGHCSWLPRPGGLQPRAMASNLIAMASNLIAMASNLKAMASNLRAMASNLERWPLT